MPLKGPPLCCFDIDVYNGLNELRSARNYLIHDGKPINKNIVSEIFNIIKILIITFTGIEPKLSNPGWTRSSGWVE